MVSDQTALKYEQKCPDCGASDFVEDHSQGDLICQNCGLVVEAHGIDESSEWRTFSDKDKESVDPNRVGGPTNHLLSDGGLTTTIGAAAKGSDGGLAHNLTRLNARSGNPDRSLLNAFRQIGMVCDKLALVKVIKDRACELYKQVFESKSIRGRTTLSVCAAVVYIACRQEATPRTFKEVCAVLPEATYKDVVRSFKFVVKELEGSMTTIHAADYMRRFCSHIGLNNTDMKACIEMANAACPKDGSKLEGRAVMPWDGRSPLSLAAAIIYLLTSLPKASKRPPVSDIAAVTGVAEVTIRSAYKDFCTELPTLVPKWFASPDDLARLPAS